MRHQPHLHLSGPWSGDSLPVPDATANHLDRVLRYPVGGAVSYTDGAGTQGQGTWSGVGVERGDEERVARSTRIVTMIVAPPRAKDRQRFIVEKLQELGVAHLLWWSTERTQSKPPRPDRAHAWAVAALEQSRGAHLMSIGAANSADLAEAFMGSADGVPVSRIELPTTVTIAIGPEGGLTRSETADGDRGVSFGHTILRTETAAVAAAAIVLQR